MVVATQQKDAIRNPPSSTTCSHDGKFANSSVGVGRGRLGCWQGALLSQGLGKHRTRNRPTIVTVTDNWGPFQYKDSLSMYRYSLAGKKKYLHIESPIFIQRKSLYIGKWWRGVSYIETVPWHDGTGLALLVTQPVVIGQRDSLEFSQNFLLQLQFQFWGVMRSVGMFYLHPLITFNLVCFHACHVLAIRISLINASDIQNSITVHDWNLHIWMWDIVINQCCRLILLRDSYHIETETKWTPFPRRNENVRNFTEICS